MQIRRIFLFTLGFTQEKYVKHIPSDSHETCLHMYTHVFSLQVKMAVRSTVSNVNLL